MTRARFQLETTSNLNNELSRFHTIRAKTHVKTHFQRLERFTIQILSRNTTKLCDWPENLAPHFHQSSRENSYQFLARLPVFPALSAGCAWLLCVKGLVHLFDVCRACLWLVFYTARLDTPKNSVFNELLTVLPSWKYLPAGICAQNLSIPFR